MPSSAKHHIVCLLTVVVGCGSSRDRTDDAGGAIVEVAPGGEPARIDGAPEEGARAVDAVTDVSPADARLPGVTTDVAGSDVVLAPAAGRHRLVGFARGTTGGGVLAETDPAYRQVRTAAELGTALATKTVRVIEIMNDLDLGWNELPGDAQKGALRAASAPLLHPVLKQTGVTTVDIQDREGLTIFSAMGATIRRAIFNIKRCKNVIVRNLRFDELWEWDEASQGKYDKQGWDFITVDMGSSDVWIDHCDFTKAYDGVVDVKGGSSNVTISWCRFMGDDGGANSFVRQQIAELEKNPGGYPLYGFLRENGFSVDDIVQISRSQKKGHLVGANDFDPMNAQHTVTLHHNIYKNMQDRVPRLRAGNVHVFNVLVDNVEAFAARQRRDELVAAMSPTSAARLSGSFSFSVTLNGAISTEGGAVLLERSALMDVASPVRNNQTDPTMASYTGKIRVLDTMYSLGGKSFRGGSEEAGSPLAPVPAPVLPFSWNGVPNLPYAYDAEDPAGLAASLNAPDGAGAGRLTWPKERWLQTM